MNISGRYILHGYSASMVFETSIFISRALVLAFLLAVKQGIFHDSLFDPRRDSLNSEALREQGKPITSLCWL